MENRKYSSSPLSPPLFPCFLAPLPFLPPLSLTPPILFYLFLSLLQTLVSSSDVLYHQMLDSASDTMVVLSASATGAKTAATHLPGSSRILPRRACTRRHLRPETKRVSSMQYQINCIYKYTVTVATLIMSASTPCASSKISKYKLSQRRRGNILRTRSLLRCSPCPLSRPSPLSLSPFTGILFYPFPDEIPVLMSIKDTQIQYYRTSSDIFYH
jgi:hypothetical protein